MNTKIIRGIAAVIKVLSAIAAIGSTPAVHLLPEKYMVIALLVLGITSASKDFLITLGDWLDDGKKNGSFKIPLLIGACLLLLPSCGTNAAGQPTFAGLTKADWALVTKDAGTAAGRAALSAGVTSYGQRRMTSAKDVIDVNP